MQTDTMAGREKLFTMRWSEEEAAKAEAVAQRYGVPVAALVRHLIAREAEALGISADAEEDLLKTRDAARRADLLSVLRKLSSLGDQKHPVPLDRLALHMSPVTLTGGSNLPELLNALRRAGYVAKLEQGYALTSKGAAAVKPVRGKR